MRCDNGVMRQGDNGVMRQAIISSSIILIAKATVLREGEKTLQLKDTLAIRSIQMDSKN